MPHADRRTPRLRRICGPGDPRPPARAPGSRAVALGSDSLAGQPASALDPRLNGEPACVRPERRGARGRRRRRLPLPRPRGGGRARAAGRRRRRSTSPARIDCATPRSTPSGTASSIRARAPGATAFRAVPPEPPLIANPGCYATAALLALAPLADAIDPASVVVDAKSGVSGAGRGLKASSHAGFVLENLSPYRVGTHQHAPEIEQALGFPVCFVPHLLPVRRGLLVDLLRRSRAATCARCSRMRTRRAGGARARRRRRRRSSRASSTPTPPRSRSSRIARPAARSSSA